MVADKYFIREQNESLVLQTIIENQPISRADVAILSNLNKATVSSITTTLLDKKLIRETGIGTSSSTGGRKPIFLSFNAQAGLTIAIDVGYNYIGAMVAYLDGTKILSKKNTIFITSDNLIDNIIGCIAQLITDIPSTHHGIVGMTVAIHGIVVDNNILFAPFYGVTGTQIYDALAQQYSFPIRIENEANLAALGEYTFAYDYENILSVSIHSGIGVGIIQNKKLQTGSHGHSGEIGHTILYQDGLACSCGNHGCLEKYASNKAIYDLYAEHYHLDHVNSDHITKSLQASDTFTKDLITQKVAELSVGINSLIMLYDPETVIINSSIFQKNPQCLDLLKSHINSVFSKDTTLSISHLGEEATLYGGIAYASNQFLKLNEVKFMANK